MQRFYEATPGTWQNYPYPVAGDQGVVWLHLLFMFITWLLVIAVLVALLRWLWKKGDKGR